MEWMTQHDDCPLCRNPISDTQTVNNNQEDQERNYYIIFRDYEKLSDEEEDDIDFRVEDFINTFDQEYSIYKWRESNDRQWYTSIRKQKYCIDMKIKICRNNFEPPSIIDKFHSICVSLNKREFYKSKQNKYKKKLQNFSKIRNKAYLYR